MLFSSTCCICLGVGGGEIVQTSTASINLKAIQIYYNSVLIC